MRCSPHAACSIVGSAAPALLRTQRAVTEGLQQNFFVALEGTGSCCLIGEKAVTPWASWSSVDACPKLKALRLTKLPKSGERAQ